MERVEFEDRTNNISLGSNVFYNDTALHDLHLPQGLTSIPQSAFYNNTNLKEVIIPKTVTNIGNTAFSYCSSLKDITFEDNTTKITLGSSSFSNLPYLENVTLGRDLASINTNTFANDSYNTAWHFDNNINEINKSIVSLWIENSKITFDGENDFEVKGGNNTTKDPKWGSSLCETVICRRNLVRKVVLSLAGKIEGCFYNPKKQYCKAIKEFSGEKIRIDYVFDEKTRRHNGVLVRCDKEGNKITNS